MNQNRTVRASTSLTPAVAARLEDYRKRRHWSVSTAIAVLVEGALPEEEEDDDAGILAQSVALR